MLVGGLAEKSGDVITWKNATWSRVKENSTDDFSVYKWTIIIAGGFKCFLFLPRNLGK